MKTEWDYTKLADAYLKRPDYSETAIDAMLSIAGLKGNSRICDIGAGVPSHHSFSIERFYS